MNKAVFLDRDGVINIEKNYVHTREEFEFIDGVFDACKQLQQDGYLLIVITNQAGIARGYYTEEQFTELTEWMLEQFESNGIEILGVYYCPHHPDFSGECDCRKPKPGMILQAAKDHNIALEESIFIGDKLSDMMAADAAKISCKILVMTGHPIPENTQGLADLVIEDLTDIEDFSFI